jgi:formylglycine-generating enzyme required for sulfatase activity
MKRIIGFSMFFLTIMMLLASFAYAQKENRPPFISKLMAQQRSGTKLVDITYEVDDPDNNELNIAIAISSDGGKTFTTNAKMLTGDVGNGINSGKDKKVVWDISENTPDVYDTNYVIKITVNDGQNNTSTIIGKDGAPMVLITAGDFQMGDPVDETADATPVHTVYLDAFYMDIYEVTNAQYKKFMDATGYQAPGYNWTANNCFEMWDETDAAGNKKPREDWVDPSYNMPNYPVVGISWDDAKAYADWAGKRLPTEAEWEKAARGGLVGKFYPWGETITHDDANYSGVGGKDKWNFASPVGSFAPNGYGLYDMSGNVWEWCADWYADNYYSNSPRENPKGPSSGQYRVLRGGSWFSVYDFVNYLRTDYRFYFSPPLVFYSAVGFRCVQ